MQDTPRWVQGLKKNGLLKYYEGFIENHADVLELHKGCLHTRVLATFLLDLPSCVSTPAKLKNYIVLSINFIIIPFFLVANWNLLCSVRLLHSVADLQLPAVKQ